MFVLAIFITAASGYFFLSHKSAASLQKSDFLLINETVSHKYDRALRSSIRTFQDRTKIQLGIVLKDKLPPGTAIEAYAAEVFKQARLGQKSNGKAILLLWSEKERLFKIEISYDLEPIFPDATCRRLEAGARTFMLSTSAFAQRDFLTEIIVTMGLHYLDYQRTGQLSELLLPSAGSSYYLTNYLSGGGGIVGRGYAATVEQVQRELKALPLGLDKDTQPDASVEVVVRRYLASLERGLGTPQLPFLTEGSRYFRMEKPHAPGYLQRIHGYYQKAGPYQIIEKAKLAAAVFPAGSPVLPILLRKDEKGLWFIDEPKVWAYYHLSEDGSSRPKYADSPYSFVWRDDTDHVRSTPIYFDRSHTPQLIEYPFNLKERIAKAENDILQNPSGAEGYFKLAELLHFEMYWLEAAAPLYERALELAPERNDIHWRLMDVYLNTTDLDGLERQYLALLNNTPQDTLVPYYYNWFRQNYY